MTERLADLAVNFGAKVQPDQILVVNAELGQERVARAVTAAAYQLILDRRLGEYRVPDGWAICNEMS